MRCGFAPPEVRSRLPTALSSSSRRRSALDKPPSASILIMSFKIVRSDEMYVCICRAVSSATVKQVIEQGASTPEEVERRCRAGGDCGACRDAICDMIDQKRDRDRRCCQIHGRPVLAA